MWVPAGFIYLAALVALFAEAMLDRAPRGRATAVPDIMGTAPHVNPSRS
jgi:hypothetical protein